MAPGCAADADCMGGQFCLNMQCVTCRTDTDCTVAGQHCVANRCQSPCVANEECPDFYDCVGGQCTHVGCRDDRECIFNTDNMLAKCTAQECQVPCQTDAACTGDFEVCQGGVCTKIGCQTDTECRYKVTFPDRVPQWLPHYHGVCRDPAAAPVGQGPVTP